MGCRHDCAINGITSTFLVQVRMCLVVIGGEVSSKMEMVFLFRSRDSSFLQNKMYHYHQTTFFWFLVHERNFQNVAAGFALFTVVETSRSFGGNVHTFFIPTCWKIHISKRLLYFFVHIQFFPSIFG